MAHKNDGRPRVLFGKVYAYGENEAGHLALVSMTRLLDVAREAAAHA